MMEIEYFIRQKIEAIKNNETSCIIPNLGLETKLALIIHKNHIEEINDYEEKYWLVTWK